MVMEHADKDTSVIVKEQHGSRKGHRLVEVLLNTRLVGDTLRL